MGIAGKLTESEEIILDLVMQYSYVIEKKTIWLIDNGCLSANERATFYLTQVGVLKSKGDGRFFTLSKKIKF